MNNSYVALPNHPDVAVTIPLVLFGQDDPRQPREIRVRYTGPADKLMAAGVATAAMLKRAPSRYRHLARMDADGHRFKVARHVGTRGGRPYTRFTVTRHKPAEVALTMPGVREAWEHASGDEWRVERLPWEHQSESAPQRRIDEDPEGELSNARTPDEWKRLFAGWLANQVGYIAGAAHRLASGGRFQLSEEDATQLQRVLRDEWHDELQRVLDAAFVLDGQAAPQVPVPERLATRTVH